jgi:2-iminoacetate synthase ThiH
MLYGHIEKYVHRVYHLRQLRELQDETHGFNCFIPLAFQPHNNEMGIERYTFGADDLKTIAVARLYLDNFQQIKSYWVMLGQDIAQLGLHFGANDMDGTVVDEKISNMAGGRAGVGMERKSIKRLIMKSRKNPQERDTLYNSIGMENLPSAENHRQAVHTLLKKAIERDMLNSDELSLLAEHGDLFSLAMTAQKIRNQVLPYNQASFHIAQEVDFTQPLKNFPTKEASDIVLDLAGLCLSKTEFPLASLFQTISTLQEKKHEITLAGFGGLLRLLQGQSLSPAQIFRQLQEKGIRLISSSSHENEGSLTHREIVKIHQAAHENGLLTIAKVEINSPLTELSPIWKSFIDRIVALRTLQETSHGILGISVEPASDSWVTAQEYVRALALTRIACPNIDHVQVPFVQLPTSREVHLVGEGTQGYLLRGQEKYAPLLLLCGANDFGTLPEKLGRLSRIYEEISSVGMHPCLRDSRFGDIASNWEDQLENSFDLRHVPMHQMTGKEYEQIPYLSLDMESAQGVGSNAAYH